ncbi:nucleotidyltransferase family protein [Paraglaciecola aquimarina]|uniref:Nucleotidyltransferase family protein n=1 Tax=Paraglaciecola algarum TaxID=3050085 RepID=A0ABS9D2P6_9ALTE|nr:nucleotidyltransferase family protein [Paraglaciecola sp. G1-23]MCF2947005.1 nucleotidyltransferase family protein [Paraglaciecola sp. G1-23]
MPVTVIMLAAGNSQRFGDIKQLADINGTPLVVHSLGSFLSKGEVLPELENVYLVLGANHRQIEKVIPTKVQKIYVKEWQKGMGQSLAEAIQQIKPSINHVFVALADQAAVNMAVVNKMLLTLRRHPSKIIASKYNGHLGVPAIFPAKYLHQLGTLEGHIGARRIIQKNLEDVVCLDCPEAELDIDTPEDLQKYLTQKTHS